MLSSQISPPFNFIIMNNAGPFIPAVGVIPEPEQCSRRYAVIVQDIVGGSTYAAGMPAVIDIIPPEQFVFVTWNYVVFIAAGCNTHIAYRLWGLK